jgi:hypothetical protein
VLLSRLNPFWGRIGLGLILLSVISFSLLLSFQRPLYFFLAKEDGPVENLGFLALFFTSMVLAYQARAHQNQHGPTHLRTGLLFAASLVFFWAAGEEISWGQRIFDIPTPPELAAVNGQGELNLHNIDKHRFDRLLARITTILALGTCFFNLRGMKNILGFPVPDAYFSTAFALLAFYRDTPQLIWNLQGIAIVVFISYLVLALKRKDLLLFSTQILATLTGLGLFHLHKNGFFTAKTNAYHEIRETLTCLLFFLYALQIFSDSSLSTTKPSS